MHRCLILALGLLLGTLAISVRADTAARVKQLKRDLKNFQVHFAYVPPKGGDRVEYPSVTLRVPAILDKRMANWPAIQIDEDHAARLLDALAGSGWLERAKLTNDPFSDRQLRIEAPGPAYTLTVSAGGWEFQERLPFNAQCTWRLMELAAAVGGDAATQLENVTLAKLAEKQPAWQRAGEIGRAMVKEMNAWLTCAEPHSKGLFRLWLHNGKAPPSAPGKGDVWVRPSSQEASLLVDALAGEGVLEALTEVPVEPDPATPGFTLRVASGGRWWQASLGWNARMRSVLEAMAGRLRTDSSTRQALDELLDRLEPMRAEWDKAAGLAAKSIEWDQAGDHAFGPWKFVYRFESDREGKVIGHWGHLYYRGAAVEGIDLGDTLRTPWGVLHWLGVAQRPDGPHGWMREAKAGLPQGRLLASARDAVRFHEIMAKGDKLLILLLCRKERLWATFQPPGVEGKAEPRDGVWAVSLTEHQQRAALSHLAYGGLLGCVESSWSRWMIQDDYELQFYWRVGDTGQVVYTINLGTKAEAKARLTALRVAWDGLPAEVLSEVLRRLNAPPAAPVP